MPKTKIIVALILLIMVVGIFLRWYSYTKVPHPANSADEYSFGWVGLSLIKDHYPIAWSGLPAYKSHDMQKINVDALYDSVPQPPPFPIDKPWFDHPPLFGLITGGFAYLKGARQFDQVSVSLIRKPMLVIAVVTSVLIFVLAWKFYGLFTGIISLLIYSVVPTYVISSRLALAENGYTPLFLLSLLLISLFLQKGNRKYLILSSVVAGTSLLFKLSAIAIPLSLIGILLTYKKKQIRNLIIFPILSIIAPFILFTIYGAYFDLDTFLKVLSSNSNRFYGAGSSMLLSAITNPKVVANTFFTDGWIIVGWISLLLISFTGFKKDQGTTIITISAFCYMLVFVLFGSESYGWYRFPFFPFLIIATARLFQKIITKPNLFIFIALISLPFGSTIHTLIDNFEFQNYVAFLRISVYLILVIFFISLYSEKGWVKKIQQVIIFSLSALMIFLSVKVILFYDYAGWFKVS